MGTTVTIGAKYGHLTVIEEAPRGKHGERRCICRCDCGNVGNFIVYPMLAGRNTHCKKCNPHSGGYRFPDIVGKRINGWDVIEAADGSSRKAATGYMFRCRCVRCGHETIKSHGELNHSRSDRCSYCQPSFNFVITGTTATGQLPDGTGFIVDTEDINLVEQHYWSYHKKDGYITSPQNVKLHRLLLGVEDPTIIVDHINRNRLDNRKSNLRIVSSFENATNHSKLSNNKSGYTGVYYSRYAKRYEVKVGYNRKRIKLGSSQDNLVLLAGMYNVAARYLFGEYVGELNDVPDPPQGIIDSVIEKCQKYMDAPASTADAFSMEVAI